MVDLQYTGSLDLIDMTVVKKMIEIRSEYMIMFWVGFKLISFIDQCAWIKYGFWIV